MKWWTNSYECPGCHVDTTLQMAAYSADGELRFDFYCFDCKTLFNFKIFASQLIHKAMALDAIANQQKTLVVAEGVKQLLAPTINQEDKKFLEQSGISPD